MFFIEFLGWIGTGMVLLAYYLVSAKKVDGRSVMFQQLNLWGSVAILINSWFHNAFPSVALNIIWIGIALFALFQIYSKRKG
jgi:hypothetical protein